MPYDIRVSIGPINYDHRDSEVSQEIVDLCMFVKAADMHLHDFPTATNIPSRNGLLVTESARH